jgi:hypothetical protein
VSRFGQRATLARAYYRATRDGESQKDACQIHDRITEIREECSMNVVVLLIVLLLLFGGGGFYLGGPAVGGSLGGILLLVLIVLLLTGRIGSRA